MIDEILASGREVMIHASFRTVREYGGFVDPLDFCEVLAGKRGNDRTLVIPVFTYSFVNRRKATIPFNRETSHALTGIVAETFRQLPGVFRTSSPTHSFTLLGGTDTISECNNPISPLGAGSVPDILFRRGLTGIALVGCGFESLSMLHYFESLCGLPYLTTNCWDYMGVEPLAISTDGVYPVIELPGCSRGFVKFEKHLLETGYLKSLSERFKFYLIDPYSLLGQFRLFTGNDPLALLCDTGCPACGRRREVESNKIIKRRN